MSVEQLTLAPAREPSFALPVTFAPFHAALQERRRTQRAIKHAVDRVLALGIALAALPLMVLIALSVRLTSAGPIFYRQERVGEDGRTFVLWKFRTMVRDADHRLIDLLRRHNRHHEPLFKVPDDPRVTAVGRWLRKYSLDELPQLINVMRGDMSIVGPRPHRPAEVALYRSVERERLRVRPGLTGLWQVSGRSKLTWHEALALDLQYVARWSLLLDLRILLRTPVAVLRGDGAW